MSYDPSKLKVVGTRPVRPDGVDKVTGRANFGADHTMPGMLWGRILRSPHAHARIKSIDTSKAESLAGVKAVVTGADLPVTAGMADAGESIVNIAHLARNVLAHDKVLYDGHAVAAVAATSDHIAREALKLIEVEYEPLSFVQDVDEAMKSDAPLLHEDMITESMDPAPKTPSNIAKKMVFKLGDVDEGFKEAELVLERSFRTKPVHQGYIEPHACVANIARDGQAVIWCSSQGQFVVRDLCAQLLQMDAADVRVIPAEIGGGFGGKTTVYLEPVALLLSRKAHRPVKLTMTRNEVFRATGPTSGSSMDVKVGATKDGRITAASAEFRFQAGAFPGSPVMAACMSAFAAYDLQNVHVTGYDVVTNGPKVAAYRAPGAPQAAFAVESVMSEMAEALNMDALDFRTKNAAKEGTKAAYGPTFGPIGMEACLTSAKDHPHLKANLGPNQGRGVANGFWFNIGGQSAASVAVNSDGTVSVIEGNPDIGGSRASMAMMAAEVLGLPVERVRPIVADTASVPHSDVTGGSRVTFATGMAVTQAAEDVVLKLRERAAKLWDIPVEDVTWENGEAHGKGQDKPLSLSQLAQKAAQTGGPITGTASINARGAGPAFTTHICDVEVDRETGLVKILRYTAIQDAGRAIHPSYVEGQMQGGVAQGIGWALNEEYIYNDDGTLENAGFLDYRMPVASDLPMIEAVIIEVPNPNHPFGVRGVGEAPIVPPLAAIANAVYDATGIRMNELPISPPRMLAALDAQEQPKEAAE